MAFILAMAFVLFICIPTASANTATLAVLRGNAQLQDDEGSSAVPPRALLGQNQERNLYYGCEATDMCCTGSYQDILNWCALPGKNCCNGGDPSYCSGTGQFITICRNSCNDGEAACNDLEDGVTIHDNSCNGISACRGVRTFHVIYPNSCNGNGACEKIDATVHEDGCNGYNACVEIGQYVHVRSGSCNGSNACRKAGNQGGLIDYCACNGDGACRSMAEDVIATETNNDDNYISEYGLENVCPV